MPEEAWAPAGVDTSRANPARIYDYFLGGKDNFAADREFAELVLAAAPEVIELAQQNRGFLRRAVRFLAEAGVDQFIDIGTGLPTQGNVHQVAHEVKPDARVVYVDNDPVVLVHSRALLSATGHATVIEGDLRDPESFLGNPRLNEMIDFHRPVAVLLLAVLHFLADADNPIGILARIRDRLAPGSYVAISHIVPGPNVAEARELEKLYQRAVTSGSTLRTPEEIRPFFGGFELVEPGLVYGTAWRPDPGEIAPEPVGAFSGVVGVGRKP